MRGACYDRAMFLPAARPVVPRPVNEPVLSYATGTPERGALLATLNAMAREQPEIPLVINGERIHTGRLVEVRMPHAHGHVLATCHQADAADLVRAADAARAAWHDWSRTPWEARAAIFLRAAELLAGPRRAEICAATMLGQSKTAHQAEIDAACELADFLRWNVHFAARLYAEQPESGPGMWNAVDYRPLEGFVLAVSPFNFTAIGGNLPAAPALMGNTVVWKPSPAAALSNWAVMRLLEEAGLPPGVINFVPGPAEELAGAALARPDLAAVHFTGSTDVFRWFWRSIGERIATYRTYPRLVGETGGKDFIVAHTSADPKAVVTAIVRGGFEYQGQKCSAASRVYLPESLFAKISAELIETTDGIAMGDVRDLHNFMGAVIDERAFLRHDAVIGAAKSDSRLRVLAGGHCDRSEGWFVRPTLIRTKDPRHDLMQRELFGPVVTMFVYPDSEWEQTLRVCDETSPYGLTGAVLANDRRAVLRAHEVLRHAAGNFYVNDKPTGAVVGQQPFGGGRASGTNDKSGSMLNLIRWVSPRTVKETLSPALDYRYPFMK